VEKGELLVELDAAPLQDRLDSQVLATERARSEQIQANAQYENQEIQNDTALARADLELKLAELARDQYDAIEGGTYQIDLQDADLAIEESQARRLIQATDLKGIEMLKKLGYRSKGDLEQARLNALAADRSLAKALASRTELTKFTREKTKLQLDGAVLTAEKGLKQVENTNEAELEQAKARKYAADRALEKEEEKLKKYTEQLEKCKIYAPHDGMATYAVESSRYMRSSSTITEGATIRERQEIITLPDLSTMQIKTAVHESVLDQIRPGLAATITVDAFPDRRYKGSVKSVGVLPDQGGWMSSDIKVYETIVTIDEKVERLRPGMTAVVQIHVERLKDVLSVPVQAIVQIGGESWCYVAAGGGVERRMLKLGKTNDKFVEIREGLNEGDRVVLNPMSVVDEAQNREAAISPAGDSEGPAGEAGESASGGAGDSSETTDSDSARPVRQGPTPPEAKSPKIDEAGPGGAARRPGGPDLMQFDQDGDGKVSVDGELPEPMRGFSGRMDANQDGFIDAQEISAMRSAFSGGQRPGRGSSDLMQYDKDGDGKVSIEEELPEPMRGFSGRMDANQDGFIDAKEIESRRSRSPGPPGAPGRGRLPDGEPTP
jgi:HlyD family secretion protein